MVEKTDSFFQNKIVKFIWMTGASCLLVLLSFSYLANHIGGGAFALGVLPPVITGWFVGSRWGLGAGIPTQLTLAYLANMHFEMSWGYALLSGVPTCLIVGGVGFCLGYLKEIQQKLSLQVRDNEIQREQIKREQEKTIMASNYARLGEMAGNIAHEIRNPLTIIDGRTRIILKHLEDENLDKKKVIKNIVSILETVERVEKIVQGMQLVASDGEKEEVTVQSLNKIFEDVFRIYEHRFKKENVKLILKGLEEERHIKCRSVELSQIIINLINNALQAIQEFSDKWVCIEILEREGFVETSITDCGHGIPKEVEKHIFEPFFTTKKMGLGMGLGLSMCHKVVDSYGGELFLNRESDNTCFTLRLPRCFENAPFEKVKVSA